MDGRCDGPEANQTRASYRNAQWIRDLAMTSSFTKWVDTVANTVATSAMIAVLPVAALMLLVHPF